MASHSVKRKPRIEPYLYLVPAGIILLIFTYWPFFRTIYRSFFITDNRGVEKVFYGVKNYTDLFSSSSFQNSIWVTVQFVFLGLLVGMSIGFITALLCSKAFPGLQVFSTIYALPMAIASSGIAMVFKIMLNQQTGALNQILGTDINWLVDPQYALFSLAFITGWLNSGLNFLYFSAALANVDESLYESASVDGADAWNKFLYVTLPSIRNITFYVFVINIIGAFQSFAQIRILTAGGPGESTNVIVHDIYRNAFQNFRYGLASAESIILFVIIAVLTAIMFTIQARGARS